VRKPNYGLSVLSGKPQNLILINDISTLDEMKIFIEADGKTSNKRGDGTNHDDLVIASALAIQGMKCGKWYL
jgi:hypothetical protein